METMLPIFLSLFSFSLQFSSPALENTVTILDTQNFIISTSRDEQHRAQKESLDNVKKEIVQYCQNDNALQQQLCESTHLAMLDNGTWEVESIKSGEPIHFTSPLPSQHLDQPDDLPLKEWARLLPVQ